MKYIDADKLIAVLERQNADKKVIEPVIRIITSLQQEQPEVNLEKELKTIRESDEWRQMQKRGSYMVEALITVARHFYELGLNARKED